MLCLHGFTDTWRTWELILPALEQRHDVLAVTLAADLIAHLIRGAARCEAASDLIEFAGWAGWSLEAQKITCPVRIVWAPRIAFWPGRWPPPGTANRGYPKPIGCSSTAWGTVHSSMYRSRPNS